ncbi:hypothetical protein EXS70_01540 [Candidatus Peribacteria bacterium]|nr:hypothetical protein [Candidatus Peribacteria bacterium]
MRQRILIILAILFALILGMLLGTILRITEQESMPIVLQADARPQIPVVRILGARDGTIFGDTIGNARIFFGGTLIIPNGSGSFQFAARDLLKEVTSVSIPSGMQFVASKRGKKYYPVTSRSAQNLSPVNRIYFPNAAVAEAAGFVPGQ